MGDGARAYHRWRLILSGARLGLTALVLALAVRAAAGPARPPVPAHWPGLALVVLIELAILGFAVQLATAPLSLIEGYELPRRFGLLHQPWRHWLADRAKGLAISGLLALVAFEVVYALLRLTPRWWVAAAAIFFAGRVLGTAVAPVWLFPLFYRLTPLRDTGLQERLLALARRAGVPVLGVWVGDQSRKSRTANGTVAGLGRTRRMILWDTLLTEFTPDEIEFVLAHELGHHAHGDVRRMLTLQGALALGKFWLADRFLRLGGPLWRLDGLADPAGLPWLALVLMALGLAAAPIANAYSRRIEAEADDFALVLTRNLPAFRGALERLARLNLSKRRPSRLEELLLYTHPSVDRRIARQLAAPGLPPRP